MTDALIQKVLAAKTPKVTLGAKDQNTLDLDGEVITINDEDANTLFETMFFRGKF